VSPRQVAPLLIIGAAVLLGLVVLVQGPPGAPASDVATPSPSLATSRPPSPGVTVAPTPNAIRPIPEGFRVQVPRLGIDLPIAEGIIQRDVEQQQTPEGWAFHLPGTAIPGQIGNTYIYSHARVGMFLSLWNAKVGDEVTITTPDGRTLAYAVSEVRPRVAPTDISVAQPSPDQRLTLQTSTGPSPSDPRFVVIALPRS
jgi:LPXTG-site transpeptidase (sortase) family protein